VTAAQITLLFVVYLYVTLTRYVTATSTTYRHRCDPVYTMSTTTTQQSDTVDSSTLPQQAHGGTGRQVARTSTGRRHSPIYLALTVSPTSALDHFLHCHISLSINLSQRRYLTCHCFFIIVCVTHTHNITPPQRPDHPSPPS